MTSHTSLLSLTDVTAGYGAGLVLKGVNLTVEKGQIVCVIGPNGSGKSTVLKTISGLLGVKSGTVMFNGEEISGMTSRRRLDLGIVHVPQDHSLFPGMTVRENMMMGAFILTDHKLIEERMEKATELFPIVRQRSSAMAGSLSGGEQKQVEVALSLMLDPALILLDEPSIGLDPKSRKLVFESIKALAADGRTILLVEQNARSGLAVSTMGAVLEAGKVALTGKGVDLLDDPEVARLYLGAKAK
jgi:branched-chain amino acid transport system ATP-binding protein